MKKVLSSQFISFFFAGFVALSATFYIGGFGNNSFYWNTFLVNVTFMGDAFFAFGISLFLLFYFNKKKQALNLALTISFVIVLVQIFKNIFSGHTFELYFEQGVYTENANLILSGNFISSHTAIAFSLAVFFAKQTKKLIVIILLFLTAALVSYSRVLLVDETLLSIIMGLIPAIIAKFLVNALVQKRHSNKIYFLKSSSRKNGFSGARLQV
jgi:membrane-associated phospholipid phosphatase